MRKYFKIYIGKIGNQEDNNVITDVIQQERSNSKCYASTFKYIYRYRLVERIELIKPYELHHSSRTNLMNCIILVELTSIFFPFLFHTENRMPSSGLCTIKMVGSETASGVL